MALSNGGDFLAATSARLNEAAPDFEVATTAGSLRRLIDFRGKPLMLGFFPMAFTGG